MTRNYILILIVVVLIIIAICNNTSSFHIPIPLFFWFWWNQGRFIISYSVEEKQWKIISYEWTKGILYLLDIQTVNVHSKVVAQKYIWRVSLYFCVDLTYFWQDLLLPLAQSLTIRKNKIYIKLLCKIGLDISSPYWKHFCYWQRKILLPALFLLQM